MHLSRKMKLLILLIISSSVFFIYKENNQNNITYLALGDGYALGIDSYGRKDYGYSDYLKDELENEKKLNNYIKSFANSTMSIKNLYDDILINKEITLKNKKINIRRSLREAELVTISIGLNDLLYQLSITDHLTEYKLNKIIEEIDTSYEKLLKEIKKYYQYDIYVIGYYNINENNKDLQKAIQKLNQVLEKKEIIFIPIYDLFEQNPNYRSNPTSIYPNNLGYQAISNQIKNKYLLLKNKKT